MDPPLPGYDRRRTQPVVPSAVWTAQVYRSGDVKEALFVAGFRAGRATAHAVLSHLCEVRGVRRTARRVLSSAAVSHHSLVLAAR